jgi:DNA-binding protein HU-beta
MSKKLLADVIRDSVGVTNVAANKAAGELVSAIVGELKAGRRFTVPGFGAFVMRKTAARKGVNPKTGASIDVPAGRTVRFKPSRKLRAAV